MTHGPEADEIAQLASKLGFSLTLDEALQAAEQAVASWMRQQFG
jgi:hypothetical protein